MGPGMFDGMGVAVAVLATGVGIVLFLLGLLLGAVIW